MNNKNMKNLCKSDFCPLLVVFKINRNYLNCQCHIEAYPVEHLPS